MQFYQSPAKFITLGIDSMVVWFEWGGLKD
jgi:hypothetical protein